MEIAKTINDFIELKNKINGMSSFRKYIGFETENGRRLIIKFKKKDILKDYEYTVLDQNFSIFEDKDNNFKYNTPFEIVQGYFQNGSIPITNMEFFNDRATAVMWLIEEEEEDEDDEDDEDDDDDDDDAEE